MNVDIKQTNTTEASAKLSHNDIVAVLGLAVKLQAGISSDQPGASVTVKLVPVDGSDKFEAEVDVMVDHNFVPAPVVAEAPKEDAAPAVDAAQAQADAQPSSAVVIPSALSGALA